MNGTGPNNKRRRPAAQRRAPGVFGINTTTPEIRRMERDVNNARDGMADNGHRDVPGGTGLHARDRKRSSMLALTFPRPVLTRRQ